MTRLAMPDGAVAGVTIEGARTGRETTYDGRIVEVTDRQHERALRELGAFPVSVGGLSARGGRRCRDCGFGSWFVTCSRCGGTCEREEKTS